MFCDLSLSITGGSYSRSMTLVQHSPCVLSISLRWPTFLQRSLPSTPASPSKSRTRGRLTNSTSWSLVGVAQSLKGATAVNHHVFSPLARDSVTLFAALFFYLLLHSHDCKDEVVGSEQGVVVRRGAAPAAPATCILFHLQSCCLCRETGLRIVLLLTPIVIAALYKTALILLLRTAELTSNMSLAKEISHSGSALVNVFSNVDAGEQGGPIMITTTSNTGDEISVDNDPHAGHQAISTAEGNHPQ
ncbi:unnamed protein product [Schistocephalus solidus]|uniref:Transmembrane protein n=1 Tax=Schistocephalus solidus TaxID=70667 RepID=A0A183T4L8_SCHSO|nr:unnamed protein product [Schistocephalus solidus]